jgi:hypothetical protein
MRLRSCDDASSFAKNHCPVKMLHLSVTKFMNSRSPKPSLQNTRVIDSIAPDAAQQHVLSFQMAYQAVSPDHR